MHRPVAQVLNTNHLASRRCSGRQELKDRLRRYELELTELEPRLDFLRHAIVDIKWQLSRTLVLPTDILHQIFDRWVDCDTNAPVVASSVCRAWRNIILSYSRAWRRITLVSSKSATTVSNQLSRWLHNSGSTLLSVTIDWTSRSGYFWDHSLWQSVITQVSNNRHRLNGLTIKVGNRDSLHEVIACFVSPGIPSHNFLKLKTLSVSISPSLEDENLGIWDTFPTHSLYEQVPNLRSFSCTWAGPPSSSFLQHIRHLSLGGLTGNVRQVLAALGSAPSLEELYVSESFQTIWLHDSDEPNVLQHLALRRLSILDPPEMYDDGEGGFMTSLLRRLKLPGLRQLQLGKLGSEGVWHAGSAMAGEDEAASAFGIALAQFLRRSHNPPIEALQLVYVDLFEDCFIECCNMLTRLRRLEVKASRLDDGVICVLGQVDTSLNLTCPQLQCLYIVGCHGFSGDSLTKMTETRRALNRVHSHDALAEDGYYVCFPLKCLHVHVCPKVTQEQADRLEALISGGVWFTPSKNIYSENKRYSLSVLPPEWDDMLDDIRPWPPTTSS